MRRQGLDDPDVLVVAAGRRRTAPIERYHEGRARNEAGEEAGQRPFAENARNRYVEIAGKTDRRLPAASLQRLAFLCEQMAQAARSLPA